MHHLAISDLEHVMGGFGRRAAPAPQPAAPQPPTAAQIDQTFAKLDQNMASFDSNALGQSTTKTVNA